MLPQDGGRAEGHVVAQRLHEGLVRNGQVLLAAAEQHDGSLAMGRYGHLGGQERLADARLTSDQDRSSVARRRLLPPRDEELKLVGPSDEQVSLPVAALEPCRQRDPARFLASSLRRRGDPPDLVADERHLTGVNPGPDLEAQRRERIDGGTSTANGRGGNVEHGEEAVARGVDLPAAEADQLAADDGVVARQDVPPTAVTQLRRPFRGADDVREQDRSQHPGSSVGHRRKIYLSAQDSPISPGTASWG